jgi:hypothetical protein
MATNVKFIKKWAAVAILKIASMFLDSQNLHLVNTLPLTFIWHLYHSLFGKYRQKCEIHAEKWHAVAILEIRF